MADVSMATLHVYDVTNSTPSTNANILRINRITRDALGIGGIFHGAIEVWLVEGETRNMSQWATYWRKWKVPEINMLLVQ